MEIGPMKIVQEHRTHWYGIHVIQEDGHYWIMDDNGGEEHVGTAFPTGEQLDAYRDAVTS